MSTAQRQSSQNVPPLEDKRYFCIIVSIIEQINANAPLLSNKQADKKSFKNAKKVIDK